VSWKGAALVAALFFGWRYRKRIWKARKHLKIVWTWLKWWKWLCIPCIAILAVVGVETHIAVSRLLLLLLLLGYRCLWNRRYRKAKGKQREVYHLVEGEGYVDRARLAREARERLVNLHPHHARYRQTPAPVVVESETSDQ
jgi:hypothetical protein